MTKKRLAIIASRFPYPLNKGDKLRLFHQLKFLADHFEIYLFAINEENLNLSEQEVVRNLCTEVELFNLNSFQKAVGIGNSLFKGEPIQVGYFYSRSIATKIKERLKQKKIDITYCQLSRTAKYGNLFEGPVVFDYQDCFSKNYERAYNNSTGLKKWFYKREWKSMQFYEKKINEDFEIKTIISAFDQTSLPFPADKIQVIPNGVDATYYKPRHVEKEYDVLFSGNLNYQPNVDAALNIIENIYPILKRKKENIKIGIAGNTSNSQILKANNDNIIVSPQVSDMRAMYAKTRIYIAPLFTGAGLQNKLLEAMSMGIPCIATHITNLSLKATDNVSIIEVKNNEELAEAITDLLEESEKQKRVGLQGQKFVHQSYSWDTANEKLYRLLKTLI